MANSSESGMIRSNELICKVDVSDQIEETMLEPMVRDIEIKEGGREAETAGSLVDLYV